MLDIEAITKTFFRRTVSERVALSGVSLHLNPGDFVTIIDSDGAGKSALLSIVSGRYQADVERVKIKGESVTKLPDYKVAKYVSRIFQDPMAGTAPCPSIEENLALAWSRSKGRTLGPALTQEKCQIFRDALVPLEQGLENRLYVKVGLLSSGQRQALSLTMTTFSKSKVLPLGEYTVALDSERAALIARITRKAVERQHLTTLMVTYNVGQALSMGNWLIMMREGRIIFELAGEEKKRVIVTSLLAEFDKLRGKEEQGLSDKMLLT